MFVTLKEEMRNSLKEIEEKTKKNWKTSVNPKENQEKAIKYMKKYYLRLEN